MASANRQKASSAGAQAALSHPVLTLPGVMGNLFWQELAEEARVYSDLLKRLERAPPDAPEREALEDAIVSSLAHLASHSAVLYESVDKAIEAEDIEVESEKVL